MAKPVQIFYVEQRGAKLRYGQKGGGLMSQVKSAFARRDMLRAQGATDTVVWVAEPVWRKMEDD